MEKDHRSSRSDPVLTPPESLSASAESETFESWTVVTEGTKKNVKTALEVTESEESGKQLDEEENRIEIIDKEENNKRDNESVDDLSDGISIISDSESAGRVSPHSFVGQGPETISTASDESLKTDKHYEPLTPPTTPEKDTEECTKVAPFVAVAEKSISEEEKPKSGSFLGLRSRNIFCISVVVALLAFFGRMNLWGGKHIPSDVAPLLQKIDDLELQNSVLRAEIDLLNKQVNYMGQQKHKHPTEGTPYKQERGRPYEKPYEKPEKPKWPGAGEMYIEPLDPYKVPSPPYNPEKEGENSPTPPVTPGPSLQHERGKEYNERKPGKDNYQKYPDSHKYYPKNGKYDPKYQKHDSGKYYKEDYKKGKEHYSNDKHYKDDHDKYRKHDGKKDHHDGYHDKHDYKRRDDDWHEKMMHQREEMRKKNDQQNSNNWYIERGNGREEARVDSHEYRREGR